MMKHYYKDVPGWAAFGGLYLEMVRKASKIEPSLFIEIGSWLGRSAALMGVEIINSGKPIALHCVDPWIDGGPDLRETKYLEELGGQSPFELFKVNVKPVNRVIIPHQCTSVEASNEFADGIIDFIMIDGDHSYEAVKADIAAWMPKMKRKSVISGDDYMWPGVKQAVEEAFPGCPYQIVKHHHNVRNSASYWWHEIK